MFCGSRSPFLSSPSRSIDVYKRQDLEQRGIIGPFGHLLHHIDFFPAKVKVVTGGFLRLFRFFREVRGIVWFFRLFGGLIFEFINTPNYRGNLCRCV